MNLLPPTRHAASRQLLLFWCFWLLGCWGGTLVTYRGLLPTPAVRWMMLSAMFGQMLLAPVIRLSQRWPASPGTLLRDWLNMNLILQAVIWPLRIGTRWLPRQTVLLSAGLAAWSLVALAIAAWGCRSSRWTERTIAAALCALLLFGEPLALGLLNLDPNHPQYYWLGRISPIRSVMALTDAPSNWDPALWMQSVAAVAAAGVAAWVVVGVAGREPRT